MNIRHSIVTLSIIAALTACGQTPANGKGAPSAPNTKPDAVSSMQEAPSETKQTITEVLEKNYAKQNIKVQTVSTTPVKGIYEILLNGKQIVYTDATGQYMFVGDLIDTNKGNSLTEDRKALLNAVDFNALPLDKAIKEVRGNGKLQVAVFSDPDCPFCRRLEHEFAKMTDITIYSFMMPIASLHPDAKRKAIQIMCQPNPTQAWNNWMRENKMPAQTAECHHSVDETIQLGEGFGFNGTPTLVFPNGKTQSGYMPMPELQQVIEQNQK